MQKQTPSRRRGFTLIELLVVIAIIAILAAILFPVFQKVRENARRTSCASNEKQIGIAFTQYQQDADEQTPGSTQWGYGWAEKIQPFIKSAAVFHCPDDSHSAALAPIAPSVNPATPISYALNGFFRQNCTDHKGGGGSFCDGANLSQLDAPSNTVLCFEALHSAHTYAGQRAVNQSGDINDPGWDARAPNLDVCSMIGYDSVDGNDAHPAIGDSYNGVANGAFHDTDGGSLNWLAADGHVKYLKKTAVSGAMPGSGPKGPGQGYNPQVNGQDYPGNGGRTAAGSPAPYVLTYSIK